MSIRHGWSDIAIALIGRLLSNRAITFKVDGIGRTQNPCVNAWFRKPIQTDLQAWLSALGDCLLFARPLEDNRQLAS